MFETKKAAEARERRLLNRLVAVEQVVEALADKLAVCVYRSSHDGLFMPPEADSSLWGGIILFEPAVVPPVVKSVRDDLDALAKELGYTLTTRQGTPTQRVAVKTPRRKKAAR